MRNRAEPPEPPHVEVLAYIEDGPRGGETRVVTAAVTDSPPAEIELPDPTPPVDPYLESSLRHSLPIPVSRYRLRHPTQRDRGGYAYMLVRDHSDGGR